MGLETALMAGMGVNAAGTVFSSLMARQEGRGEQKIYDANAAVLRQEADAALEKGNEEAVLIKERARKLLAMQIANSAAGGGDLSGSTLAVIGNSAFEAERDVQMTLRNAQLDARGLRNKATIQNAYGSAARRTGNIRAVTNLFGGISSMLPLYASYKSLGFGGGRGGNTFGMGSYGTGGYHQF